jgi:hypothetical protein
MKITVIDFELPNYICTNILDGRTMEPLDAKQSKEYLSELDKSGDVEIYFVDVKDETWNEFKTENSKRVELDLDGLMKLIQESSELILIKGNRAESCTYYPEDDDP